MKVLAIVLTFLLLFSCENNLSNNLKSTNNKIEHKSGDLKRHNVSFKEAVDSLIEISYHLKEFDTIIGDETLLNTSIIRLKTQGTYRNIDKIDVVNVSNVEMFYSAGIERETAIGSFIPRAYLECWECKDEQSASEILADIDYIKENFYWDVISKSPITYWQQGERLLFVVPAGFYMLDEVPVIKDFITARLGESK